MEVVLIHNPEAGDDDGPSAKRLKKMIRDAGHDVRYFEAKGRKWKGAIKEPGDLIAVAGGDGTVTKVARRIIGQDVPLAILPVGTANNIARTLGLKDVPLDELIASWESAPRKRYDAGIVSGPWKSRHFIEGVGVGLFTQAMLDADSNPTLENLQDAEARTNYARHLLRRQLKICPPMALEIKVDGRELSGDYVLLEAMNMEFLGPNLYLAPHSVSDDGMLDVVLIAEEHREEFDEYLSTWEEGVEWPAHFETVKGARLEIEWKGFEVHIDDAVYPQKDAKPSKRRKVIAVDVEHDALEFIARE